MRVFAKSVSESRAFYATALNRGGAFLVRSIQGALMRAPDSPAGTRALKVSAASGVRSQASSAAVARHRLLNFGVTTRPTPAAATAFESECEVPKSTRELTLPSPPGDGASVLIKKSFGGRTFVLNRPKALNALNLEMVRNMTPQLKAWDQSDLCKIIMITSSSTPRAFCAGGDVKSVVDLVNTEQRAEALKFFEEEYQLNYLIATLKKPYMAILDGITMGGGVGLSVHGTFRIATENTVFAMPETAIGFIPDVGGSFFLSRMDGELGTFLGLTGQRIKGADVFYAGIATHYVPSQRIEALRERLSELENDDPDVINMAIEEFSEIPTTAPMSAVDGPDRVVLDRCFAHDNVERIIEELEKENTNFANMTLRQLESMSPTSLKITLAMLRDGKRMSLQKCLQMEYYLVSVLLEQGDFAEGVTAVLVDKRKPNWRPARLADVSDAEIKVRQTFQDLSSPQLKFHQNTDFANYPFRRFAGPSENDVRQIVDGSSSAAGGNAWNAQDLEQFFAKSYHWKHGVREKVRRVIARKCVTDGEGWLRWKP